DEIREWAPFHPLEISWAMKKRLPLAEARRWAEEGVPIRDAVRAREVGLTLADLRRWQAAGFCAADAWEAKETGVAIPEAVAWRGTFTAAAEALNMTQSALSEQILQFERECGSPLFNRGHSGVTLTPAGEYLLHQAEGLLSKAAETREGLASFRHGYQDRMRVSSVLGPLQSWLPAALVQFAQVRP